MSLSWKTIPTNIPIADTDCWVRLNYWFGQPFIAQYDSVTQTWSDILFAIEYPVWSISRWKYVT